MDVCATLRNDSCPLTERKDVISSALLTRLGKHLRWGGWCTFPDAGMTSSHCKSLSPDNPCLPHRQKTPGQVSRANAMSTEMAIPNNQHELVPGKQKSLAQIDKVQRKKEAVIEVQRAYRG